MPATSRKRNKGKERKAKQLVKKEETERADAHAFWRSFYNSTECYHGCAMLISDDHPVSSFMDQFFINLHKKRMIVSKNLRTIFQTHKQIWNNESYRKIVLETLIRIGTNMLLKDKSDMIWHVFTAQAIIAIEHYNGKVGIESVMNSRMVASKWRDLSLFSIGSRRRDALQVFP